MIDTDVNPCHGGNITAPVPEFGTVEPCIGNSETGPLISKWGGPRANSGGARPGAGRKPTPKPLPIPAVPRWSVVAFWGQAEISATSELTRAGYETYLPMVAIRRRDPVIPSRWNIARVPYLSGYGFIRITSVESREPILATRGIREVLLRPDGRPGCVSDGEIERLRAKDAERLELPKLHAPVLPVGSVVAFEDGPFHEGRVIQCDGLRTQVGVEMFGRTMPVWVDRVMVRPR